MFLDWNAFTPRASLFGGVLIGIGCGWAGFCPRPALVAMASGSGAALLFGVAMLAGMPLHDRATVAAQRLTNDR